MRIVKTLAICLASIALHGCGKTAPPGSPITPGLPPSPPGPGGSNKPPTPPGPGGNPNGLNPDDGPDGNPNGLNPNDDSNPPREGYSIRTDQTGLRKVYQNFLLDWFRERGMRHGDVIVFRFKYALAAALNRHGGDIDSAVAEALSQVPDVQEAYNAMIQGAMDAEGSGFNMGKVIVARREDFIEPRIA